MDRITSTVIIVGVIVLALAAMLLGWRALVRRNGGLISPDSVPDSVGEVIAGDKGLYVATTLAERPFERVAAHGLGFQSRSTVTIATNGITVARTGSSPFFIGSDSVLAVQRATWAIDKAVEPGGLVVITWRLGETELDSYFRMDGDYDVLLNAGAELMEGSA